MHASHAQGTPPLRRPVSRKKPQVCMASLRLSTPAGEILAATSALGLKPEPPEYIADALEHARKTDIRSRGYACPTRRPFPRPVSGVHKPGLVRSVAVGHSGRGGGFPTPSRMGAPDSEGVPRHSSPVRPSFGSGPGLGPGCGLAASAHAGPRLRPGQGQGRTHSDCDPSPGTLQNEVLLRLRAQTSFRLGLGLLLASPPQSGSHLPAK